MKTVEKPFGLECRLRRNVDGRSSIQIGKARKTVGSFSAQESKVPDFIIFNKTKKIKTTDLFTTAEIDYIEYFLFIHKAERVQPLLSSIKETQNLLKETDINEENIETIKAQFNEMISELEKKAA
tara:strand:+ start:17558 stop:17932 length:375 start_codon:yes stop_codon:yes gene_type:complete